jgi:osmotically-inducible protein OsmY
VDSGIVFDPTSAGTVFCAINRNTIGSHFIAQIDDRSIREKLLAELKAQRWAEVSPANVTVKDDVVHLWSSYLSEQEKRALVVAAENIPGVRRVEDHMRRVGTTLLG